MIWSPSVLAVALRNGGQSDHTRRRRPGPGPAGEAQALTPAASSGGTFSRPICAGSTRISSPTRPVSASRASGSRPESVISTDASSSEAIVDSPTTPHLVWSASTTSRRVAATIARLVSASTRFGEVKPAPGSMPWTPMNRQSTCSDWMVCTSTGPTSASEVVRTPPTRTTTRSGRSCAYSTSATGSELVTTVSSGMRVKWRANAWVVVPALIAIAVPGCTNSAARRAIASLAGRSWLDLASKPGSSVLPRRGRVAPPWTLETSPRLASASRSRRMVMSETPSSSVRSLTRTPPLRWSSSRIRSCRWAGSISSTVLSHDGHGARGQRQPPGDLGAGEQLQPARLQRRRLVAVVDGEQPRGPPPLTGVATPDHLDPRGRGRTADRRDAGMVAHPRKQAPEVSGPQPGRHVPGGAVARHRRAAGHRAVRVAGQHLAEGAGVAAEPHLVVLVDDAAEELHQQAAARLDEAAKVGGGRVADQVQARRQHQLVAVQVGGRVRQVGGDAAPPEGGVVVADQLQVGQVGAGVGVQLHRPPGLPVPQQRHLRVDPAALHLGDPPQFVAERDHLAPDLGARARVGDHRRVELLGPGA